MQIGSRSSTRTRRKSSQRWPSGTPPAPPNRRRCPRAKSYLSLLLSEAAADSSETAAAVSHFRAPACTRCGLRFAGGIGFFVFGSNSVAAVGAPIAGPLGVLGWRIQSHRGIVDAERVMSHLVRL